MKLRMTVCGIVKSAFDLQKESLAEMPADHGMSAISIVTPQSRQSQMSQLPPSDVDPLKSLTDKFWLPQKQTRCFLADGIGSLDSIMSTASGQDTSSTGNLGLMW